MKQSDVKIGEILYTYIGPNLRAVKIVREVPPDRFNQRVRYVCANERGEELPKPRTAAALRQKRVKQ